jgi:hypothetical protein
MIARQEVGRVGLRGPTASRTAAFGHHHTSKTSEPVFRPNAGLSAGLFEPMRSGSLSNFAPDRLG